VGGVVGLGVNGFYFGQGVRVFVLRFRFQITGKVFLRPGKLIK
jgi:hypothetical protein